MRVSHRTIRTAVALLLSFSSAAVADDIFAIDKQLGKSGGWLIGFSEERKLCLASAEFQNGTVFSAGQNVSNGDTFLGFSNSAWDSIEVGRTYRLVLGFGRGKTVEHDFAGAQHGNQKALYADDLKASDLALFSKAASVEILYGSKALGGFSLRGTRGAVNSIARCVARRQDPFAESAPAEHPTKPAAEVAGAAKAKERIDKPALIDFGSNAEPKLARLSAYLKVFDSIERGFDSQRRYYSWCCLNPDKGPTGKEKHLYGIYNLIGAGPADLPELDGLDDPAVTEGDRLMAGLIAAYRDMSPVVEEAYKYYEADAYKLDDFEGAREIHLRLHPVLQRFRKAYSAAANFVANNIPNYREVSLPISLRDKTEAEFAYDRANLAYTEYTLRKRSGIGPKQLDILLKEVIRTIGELQSADPDSDSIIGPAGQLVQRAKDVIRNCTEEFWKSTGQCEESPFD